MSEKITVKSGLEFILKFTEPLQAKLPGQFGHSDPLIKRALAGVWNLPIYLIQQASFYDITVS